MWDVLKWLRLQGCVLAPLQIFGPILFLCNSSLLGIQKVWWRRTDPDNECGGAGADDHCTRRGSEEGGKGNLRHPRRAGHM